MATTLDRPLPQVQTITEERRESYTALVWRKFRRNKIAITGGLLIIMLISMAVFADFLSPTDPVTPNMQFAYTRPQQIYFVDPQGQFHLRPFTYTQKQVLDPKTFLPTWEADMSKPYP